MGEAEAASVFALIEEAYRRPRRLAIRTPLIELATQRNGRVLLKLENLQPVGSAKIRGVEFGLAQTTESSLADGVWTSSSGNMGRALAFAAGRRGIPCTVVLPERTPPVKVAAITRLGAQIRYVPYETWWAAIDDPDSLGLGGLYFHGFDDVNMLAGHGAMALEILDELPDVDSIVVPFGGGGMACGVGAALRGARPDTRCTAVELEHLAPLAAALAAGKPTRLPGRPPKFLSGVGGPIVTDAMWPLARDLVSDVTTVSGADAAAAVRMLATDARVIAEGAGAITLAAVLAGDVPGETVACVISGGNIDQADLVQILNGETPEA